MGKTADTLKFRNYFIFAAAEAGASPNLLPLAGHFAGHFAWNLRPGALEAPR